MSEIKEECGIFGIYSPVRNGVASAVYYGLYALQHRGQESSGIAVCDDGLFTSYKNIGLVGDVFNESTLDSLGKGFMAIGHVRYGADCTDKMVNAQPMVVNHVKGGMALAHNGALTNSFQLKRALELKGSIFHTQSDTEVISYIITAERLKAASIEQAVCRAMDTLEGAYSLVIMSPTKLIAVRDPHGFRPLCYGQTEDGSYVVASESCAINAVGAAFIRDLLPGEIIVFDENGCHSVKEHCGKCPKTTCIFEYIYIARPDSVIDGCSVHYARLRAGVCLAERHPVKADVVVGVPDTGIDAAIGYARRADTSYGLGFIKNRYIGRTFIAPGQKLREDQVRIKLNPIAETVSGKRVVLVEDSIVRGTTCARTVKLLRDAGATEIHLRVSSPPFIEPCFYGTDIRDKSKLISVGRSTEEIKTILGVDSLGFLELCDLDEIACETSGFCSACFNGRYPTAVPDQDLVHKFDIRISDNRQIGFNTIDRKETEE